MPTPKQYAVNHYVARLSCLKHAPASVVVFRTKKDVPVYEVNVTQDGMLEIRTLIAGYSLKIVPKVSNVVVVGLEV